MFAANMYYLLISYKFKQSEFQNTRINIPIGFAIRNIDTFILYLMLCFTYAPLEGKFINKMHDVNEISLTLDL